MFLLDVRFLVRVAGSVLLVPVGCWLEWRGGEGAGTVGSGGGMADRSRYKAQTLDGERKLQRSLSNKEGRWRGGHSKPSIVALQCNRVSVNFE